MGPPPTAALFATAAASLAEVEEVEEEVEAGPGEAARRPDAGAPVGAPAADVWKFCRLERERRFADRSGGAPPEGGGADGKRKVVESAGGIT